MNSADAQPGLPSPAEQPSSGGSWSRWQWLLLIVLVFGLHVLLLYLFGFAKPVPPRSASNVPWLQLAGSRSEFLGLNDPTLFTGPHPQGFAGPAWLEPTHVGFHAQDWTEPPRWLNLSTNELTGVISQWLQDNPFTTVQLELKPKPELKLPPRALPPASVGISTVQVEGELARRQGPAVRLPALPYSDVIAPSKVQVLVDAAGNVASAVLMPPDDSTEAAGHSADADQLAVQTARSMRFQPLQGVDISVSASRSTALALGQLTFRWATVPMATTNASVIQNVQ